MIEDVETDEPFAPLRPVARAAGYRAVQSTPLCGRDGRLLGMLSTHFRSPHRPEDVGAVAAGLVGYLARPFYLDGHEVHLTASIGVAVPPAAGAEGGDVDLATLLEDAEGAMLVAASTGGGRCVRRPPRRATTLPRPGCAAARAAVS